MDVSLVICTRNRYNQIQKCLEYVVNMNKPLGFELIVVNNGSLDKTDKVLKNFSKHADFDFKIIYEPQLGLARARNTGWQSAKGEIIVFTDDDCYVDICFIDEIKIIFKSNPNLSFLSGRILLFDNSDLRMAILENTEEKYFLPYSFIRAGEIHGANFAFRRSVLALSGGFDILLGAGTQLPSEDVEMVTRLSAMGFYGLYSPLPVVWHHHGRKTELEKKMINRSYDIGRGAYFVKALFFDSIRPKVLHCWLINIKYQNALRTKYEIYGAMIYLFRFLLHKLNIFVRSIFNLL